MASRFTPSTTRGRTQLIHRDVKPANIILCERGGTPDVARGAAAVISAPAFAAPLIS